MRFGAILAPGFDPWTALWVILPIIVLYEVGLLFAWLAHPSEGDYLHIKIVPRIPGFIGRLVLAFLRRPWVPVLWVLKGISKLLGIG